MINDAEIKNFKEVVDDASIKNIKEMINVLRGEREIARKNLRDVNRKVLRLEEKLRDIVEIRGYELLDAKDIKVAMSDEEWELEAR